MSKEIIEGNREFDLHKSHGNSDLRAALYTVSYLKGVFYQTKEQQYNFEKIREVLTKLVNEEVHQNKNHETTNQIHHRQS